MVRFKNRYLLVELAPFSDGCLSTYEISSAASKALTATNIATHLRQAIGMHFGQVGTALVSQPLSVKYCNATTGTLIIRTGREQVPMLWATLTLLSSIPEASANEHWLWKVIHVAGTIKSAQKEAMRHSMRRIREMPTGSGADQKQRLAELTAKCSAALRKVDA